MSLSRRPSVLLGLLACAGLLGSSDCHRSQPPASLELRFLDVGQGDAVLIRSQDKVVLVDAGPSDAVVGQLRGLGVSTIDLLVASHAHSDHIGGADAVLSQLTVRNYLDNAVPATTQINQTVIGLVASRQVTYLQPTARTITVGDATLQVIPPADSGTGDQNNASVGLILRRGSFRALLTGDGEQEEIAAWLAAAAIPDVDVLKAAHHGSSTGVTAAWLNQARPEVVVISVGAGNPYGHPHAAALTLYQAGGRLVYRTDLNGAVTVTVDSLGGYQVRPERSP